MDTTGNTDRNATKRRVLTIVGGLLAAAGLVVGAWGFIGFVGGMTDTPGIDSTGRYFAMFGGGAFALVIGFGLLNAGTLRAQSRYVADETSDALRTAAGAVGDGLRGSDSRFCTDCGTALSGSAKFCSSCGRATA